MQATINLISLRESIREILKTKASLFDLLLDQFKLSGKLPEELLNPDVLERLFIDEMISDANTGHLFGITKSRIQGMRSKHKILLKNPKYYLNELHQGLQKDMTSLIATVGEEEANKLKSELEHYFNADPKIPMSGYLLYISNLLCGTFNRI